MNDIKRTERGWAGHGICSDRCLFHRNTLIEYNKLKIVVSTIGEMFDIHAPNYPNKLTIVPAMCDRYYETLVFYAKEDDVEYYDADCSRPISIDCDHSLYEAHIENKANDMHEAVVTEIIEKLQTSVAETMERLMRGNQLPSEGA